jgi:hypothetical protein
MPCAREFVQSFVCDALKVGSDGVSGVRLPLVCLFGHGACGVTTQEVCMRVGGHRDRSA